PDFSKYQPCRAKVLGLLEEVTSQIEPLSLDEAYLDVTENRWAEASGLEVARRLKARIREVTGLTASAGVGPNKMVAKLASEVDKPDGLVAVSREEVQAFLGPLPVNSLFGVGPKTASRLERLGIKTVSDVRVRSEAILVELLGRHGHELWQLAHGRDDRAVVSERAPKSRGSEVTLAEDVKDRRRVMELIQVQAVRVGGDLVRSGLAGRTVTLKIRYGNFQTITRSRTLRDATDDAARIAQIAMELCRATQVGARPVRLVGVSLSNLTAGGTAQLRLF
ncbi:MAG: DNA polymerase IV, partial [Myxococcales bacterium]|nr:DNA polymerase IV [Myxococcales bacterium]